MAYRGRYELGDEPTFQIVCRDVNKTPTVPTDCPTADVWSGTTKVVNQLIPVLDRYGTTAAFQFVFKLDSRFAVGQYSVDYRYKLGATHVVETDHFEVIAGGNADGNVIAMTFYDRPHADFLVYQLDTGKIAAGRNPTV